MKLIIAIIQDEDAGEVISHLNEAEIQVTRLATKGGFLRSGNTTIMTGVDDEKVDEALKIIEENSKSRTQYATLPSSCGAMHGFIPVSYTHLDVYKRQFESCRVQREVLSMTGLLFLSDFYCRKTLTTPVVSAYTAKRK